MFGFCFAHQQLFCDDAPQRFGLEIGTEIKPGSGRTLFRHTLSIAAKDKKTVYFDSSSHLNLR